MREPASFDSEAVLEHLDWVQGLARSLVTDPNVADDLAQETWLAALRKGPPEGRPLRAWLGRVVHNAARQLGRREGVRRGHEESASKPDALPSTAELMEKISVQRSVVDQVFALDEPYRRTILCRYFEDLSPREIARRTGQPVATVKTQLRRGLEKLRAQLDRSNGGDGKTWALALAPLVPKAATWSAIGLGGAIVGAKQTAALVGAVVLFVLGGWWYAGRDAEPERVAAQGTGAEELGDAATPESTEVPPETPLRAERLTLDDPLASSSDAPPKLRVIVIEGKTGRRVEGAYVLTGTKETLRQHDVDERQGQRPHIERSLRWSHGTKGFEANAQGEVILERTDELAVVAARRETLFGWTRLSPDSPSELRIELAPDPSIVLRVVDTKGEPVAGAPVAVGVRGTRYDHLHWESRTGPDGVATLDSAAKELSEGLVAGRWYYATLPIPLAAPVDVPIDPKSLPTEPIELVLPPTGSLVVRMKDVSQEDWAWCSITPIFEDPSQPGVPVRGRRHSLRGKDGAAEWTHVGLGLRLWVQVTPNGGQREAEATVDGPTTPGETTVVTLESGGKYPWLEGRLVDAAGQPVASTRLQGVIRFPRGSREGSVSFSGTKTADDGTFRVRVRAHAPLERATELEIETVSKDGEIPLRGERTPEWTRTETGWSAGDVLVRAAPVVAKGRVVDTDGEPVYWAAVRVKKKTKWNNEQGFTWQHANEFMTMSQEDGSFRIDGELGEGEYSVFATKDGFLNAELTPLVAGMRDVEIVLEAPGELAGSVLLPEGIPRSAFLVRVEPLGPRADAWRSAGQDRETDAYPFEDGRFHVAGIPPGNANVHFFRTRAPEPLLTVTDVTIPAGETCRDPRLQNVDLRDLLRAIVLRAKDPDGRAIPAGHVALQPDATSDAPRHVALSDGRATLHVSSPHVDLEVFAPGYLPRRLEGVTQDEEVVLERGYPVRVRLPFDFALPDSNASLRVLAIPQASTTRYWNESVVSPDGAYEIQWLQWEAGHAPSFGSGEDPWTVLLHVPEPGDYLVQWVLAERDAKPSYFPKYSFLSDRATGRIDGSGAEALWEIAPDAERYAKALEAFDD